MMPIRPVVRRLICWTLTLVLSLSSVAGAAMMGGHGHGQARDAGDAVSHDPGGAKTPCAMHGDAHGNAKRSHHLVDTWPGAGDDTGPATQEPYPGHCNACVLCSVTLFGMDAIGECQGRLSLATPIENNRLPSTPFDSLFKPPRP